MVDVGKHGGLLNRTAVVGLKKLDRHWLIRGVHDTEKRGDRGFVHYGKLTELMLSREELRELFHRDSSF